MNRFNIPMRFYETAKKYAANNALGQKYSRQGNFEYITYHKLNEMVSSFSVSLRELKIEPADKIALMAENSIEWVIADIGIMSIQAVNVPVYPTVSHIQLEYILNNCNARGIIVSTNTNYQ